MSNAFTSHFKVCHASCNFLFFRIGEKYVQWIGVFYCIIGTSKILWPFLGTRFQLLPPPLSHLPHFCKYYTTWFNLPHAEWANCVRLRLSNRIPYQPPNRFPERPRNLIPHRPRNRIPHNMPTNRILEKMSICKMRFYRYFFQRLGFGCKCFN